jgi:hypothetical protein
VNDVYVFVGPTLSVDDASAELDAIYLPPAAMGDVYQLWRLRPRVIGIIDGYFEHGPAVWHKEIMWVMERGVHVFGSAGAGALRAAELETFGMRGIGWVFQAFRDGTLDQDDEVAVQCGNRADGYRPRSEAMVNIRQTLRAARRERLISEPTCELITQTAKITFYARRNWPDLLETSQHKGANPAQIAALRSWLDSSRIDQMADDALAMLREMRSFLDANPAPKQVRWTTANTTRWSALRHEADTLRQGDPANSAPRGS